MPKEAATQAKEKPQAVWEIPTDLNRLGVAEITAALRQLLADTFALYLKTKNFHWHMTGQHFRDYHLLLDEHSEQIFDMTMISPSVRAKSGEPRCARLAISHGINA